jgi:hypothetical protein
MDFTAWRDWGVEDAATKALLKRLFECFNLAEMMTHVILLRRVVKSTNQCS